MLQSFRTMLGRLQKVWKKIKPQHLWLGLLPLVLLGAFLFVEPAHAQVMAGAADWLLTQVAKIMLVVARLAIGLSIFFLRFFIMLASYNNYIDVSVVQLGWVMVRDVANMFFVVALLLIAFGTILGLEEYEWKKNLAKLILSAILINFSNLIAQLCIDVAHVFTITFLNAISATAGGNIINMFKLDQVLQLTAVDDPSNINIELLAAVLPAMLFAIMAAVAIGSYVVVMAARVVALWALIVISPLAFILGVIPQTKSYADKWWAEFSKYVIVAPIMVFFLWLSFATVGLGSIASEIEQGLPANSKTSGAEQQFGVQRLSMSKVTSWENMANFLIAFAFMMYGIKATQETGVVGSGMIGSAVEFGKKVAMVATGYAAGRWLTGKAGEGAKFGVKALGAGAFDATVGFDRVEILKNYLDKNILKGYSNWKTQGPQVIKFDETNGKIAEGVEKGKELTEEERLMGFKVKENDKGERYKSYHGYDMKISKDEAGNILYKKKIDENGNEVFETDKNGSRIAESMKPKYESWIQGYKHRRHTDLITSRKQLEKVENDTKMNEEIIDKSIEAQPTHWFSSDNKAMGKDFDRVKKGMLMAMEKRSVAKTDQFAAEGEDVVMDSKRYKDGKFQANRGTVAEQIAEHEGNTAKTRAQIDEVMKTAKSRFAGSGEGKKLLQGKIKADLEVKGQDAIMHGLESKMANVVVAEDKNLTEAQNKKLEGYEEKLKENSANAPDFYKKQEEILTKMFDDGIIDTDQKEEMLKNSRITEGMQHHAGLPTDDALAKLVAEGVITDKEKDKVKENLAKSANGRTMDNKYLMKKKENVLQRTIAEEKAGHLEAEKMSTTQKEEEELFAKSGHGKTEATELAILKEKTAASEAEIKKVDEKAKADEAARASGDFFDARAKKIAAEKQAHTEGLKTSTTEKEAESEYVASDHGKEEAQMDAVLKERTLAAEGKIKRVDAEGKSIVATQVIDGTESDELLEQKEAFAKARRERIASDKTTQLRDEKVKAFEKAAELTYQEGAGKSEVEAKTVLAAHVATIDAAIKELENDAKKKLIDGDFDGSAVPAGLEGALGGGEFSYESEVSKQNVSQIFQNALTLLETKMKNTVNGQLMLGALDKEAEASALIDEAGAIHSDEAGTEVAKLEGLQAEKKKLSTKEAGLQKAVQEILKTRKGYKDKTIALEARLKTAEAKGEPQEVRDVLQNQINEILAQTDNVNADMAKANEELGKFNNGDEGKALKKLENEVEVSKKEVNRLDAASLSPKKVAERDALLEEAEKIQQKNKVWKYAAAKALEEVSNVDYQVKHNTLLSDVEQTVVHDRRGIDTPTTALTMASEHYGKTYAGLNYNQFVSSLGTSLKKLNDRRRDAKNIKTQLDAHNADPSASGLSENDVKKLKKKLAESEITDDDKAAYAGMLLKGQKENWIDDAIWKFMQSSMEDEVKGQLGWKDQIFDNKKINDIMSLFASGANMEFAKVNSYVSDMMDVATIELGMEEEDFLDKLENHSFSPEEQETLISRVSETRDDEYNLDTNTELLKELFKKDNKWVELYKDETNKNQAQIQLIAGLRDPAAASSHPENGGHGKSIKTKKGKAKDILIGQKMAEKNVLAEVKKAGVGSRSAMQSHAGLKIDEASGFATETRQASYGTIRSGINSANDHRGTNERLMMHSAGLSSSESKEEYISNDGFEVTGKKADGTESGRHKWIKYKGGNFRTERQAARVKKVQEDNGGAAITADGVRITDQDQIDRQVTTNDIVNYLFAGELVNTPDWLLTMAKLTGINDSEALNKGAIKMRVLVHGQEKNLTEVNQLITLYNTGAFQWKGDKPLKHLIPMYTPKLESKRDGGGGQGGVGPGDNPAPADTPPAGEPPAGEPPPKPRKNRKKAQA